METLLINTKHSETLYKIATILDDAGIKNCKIDNYMRDDSLVIIATPEVEYKCGDYVVLENGIKVIFDKYENTNEIKVFAFISRISICTLHLMFCGTKIKRKLSKTEILEFNEKLSNNSYRFNIEKLKLEKLPPRAKKGNSFYCMSRTFEFLKSTDNRDETSNKLYDSGNYFLESVNCKEFIKRVINNR
jgi:hypothetical protein